MIEKKGFSLEDKQKICTSDEKIIKIKYQSTIKTKKKRGQSLFQSFKPVTKCDNLNSERMVGNYREQKARRGHVSFSAVSQ